MSRGTEASSSSRGFFQAAPHIENQFVEDAALRRVLKSYLPSSIQYSIAPELNRFGDLVLSRQVLDWVADAETNVPKLRTWDSFGKRKDELVTAEGWRRLQELGQEEGILAIPYENKSGQYSRFHQFLKYHIWTGSSATVTCPSAMTDGAARLLSNHLSKPTLSSHLRPILSSALSRLISRDISQAWTSGQWMTERKGGSDVSGTETVAVKSTQLSGVTGIDGAALGDWSISGFKWFSSATDANMAILLARTPGSSSVSAFYAPMRRTVPSVSSSSDASYGLTGQSISQPDSLYNSSKPGVPRNFEANDVSSLLPYNPQRQYDPEAVPGFYAGSSEPPAFAYDAVSSLLPYNPQIQKSAISPATITPDTKTELNGIRIQRLKSKLGTRAVPTAELELDGMRAHLIGNEGRGVAEISAILNITRMHNAVSALGLWGRGLAIGRAFARVRVIGGRKLSEIPAHVRTMANQEVEYRGLMHLTYFTVLLLGISEQSASVSSLSSSYNLHTTALEKVLPQNKEEATLLLRFLTPVIKALTAKASIAGLSECMESLGGVGYLENEEQEFNIARLARDANVLSIWEGTTDIMATDFLKVFKSKHGGAVKKALTTWLQGTECENVEKQRWQAWFKRIDSQPLEVLLLDGRILMWELGRLIAGVLLTLDAERDGDETSREIAWRWMRGGGSSRGEKVLFEKSVGWDRRIVFGDGGSRNAGVSKL